MYKVSVITLGCAKNLVDSERIVSLLEQNGMQYIENAEKADAIVINTCGFIGDAKKESIEVILDAATLKQKGKLDKLIVAGCLSERYKNDLSSQIPEVDAFFGVNQFPDIIKSLEPHFNYQFSYGRHLLTPSHFAYVKISDGCSHKCSFCAIPLIKGKHLSRSEEEIVAEAETLVSNGVREIILIAQDSTYYGMDIYQQRRLPQLVERLSDIPNLKWLRIMYLFPLNFPWHLIEIMSERKNICNYIDIPLQHVSERILSSMQRPIPKMELFKMIARFRKLIPDIALRSTFITGYPGETQAEHKELMDFLAEAQLDRVGVFKYSQEENTNAFSLKDNVPAKTKEKRLEELMLLQQEISLKKNKLLIGSTKKVKIDFEEKDHYLCRSQHEAPDIDIGIILKKTEKAKPGDFLEIKVTNAEAYDIYGDIISINKG